MFKRRKKKLEFSEYNGNGKTKRGTNGLLTTFDRMEYYTAEIGDEEEMFKICDTILGGKAVLANFDKLEAEKANHILAFISGVVYATEGQIFKLDNRLFVFGRKEEYEDGSLLQYIEDVK